MNMGDFRGSDVPNSGSQNSTFQWINGMSADDKQTLQDLMAMDEVQAGLDTLAENFPAFASMIDALSDATATDTTEAPTTTQSSGGMGKK